MGSLGDRRERTFESDRCTHLPSGCRHHDRCSWAVSCVKYRWRNVASDKSGLAHHPISKRKVRFTYDTGSVTLSVRGVAYPFVEGSVDSADGAVVAVDLGHVRKVETVKLDAQGRELIGEPIQIDKERWASLVSQDLFLPDGRSARSACRRSGRASVRFRASLREPWPCSSRPPRSPTGGGPRSRAARRRWLRFVS